MKRPKRPGENRITLRQEETASSLASKGKKPRLVAKVDLKVTRQKLRKIYFVT